MRLVFGELDGHPSQRGAAFHALCQKAGFDSVNSNQVLVALWEKFVLLATNSSVVALTRLPFGKLRDDPEVFAASCATIRRCSPCSRRAWRSAPPSAAPAASPCAQTSRPGSSTRRATSRRR
jgi:2-dehydropantoate 2-reductase